MRSRQVTDPDSSTSAYASGLRMLSRRELSVAQVRERLGQRGYAPGAIETAVDRLRSSGALDDERVARAAARTRAQVKRQGRSRVLRELAAIGLDRAVAEQAVNDVFGALDEPALLAHALARRARGQSLADPAARRRIFAALVRQGFAPDKIIAAMKGTRDE